MELRPHLVLDGGLIAADAVGANEIVLYVGSEHTEAHRCLARALAEREPDPDVDIHLVAAPVGYVAGEATAVVRYLNEGDARPTFLDTRPHEHGVAGHPTLVQNVESLAYAALIARNGDDWFRSAGRQTTRGSALITVSGSNHRRVVQEIEYGTSIGEVARMSGTTVSGGTVLLGGYFGAWAALDTVLDEPLDPASMRDRGLAFGCGVLSFRRSDACGVAATAEIMTYLANATAEQCGPCVLGLASLAQATRRLADGTARDDELENIGRWAGLAKGRGACHHPDGAVGMLRSALAVYGDDFASHQMRRRCLGTRAEVA
jgi:NADH:ubiquinone oxidoreductase subunit F (NADH-binding)